MKNKEEDSQRFRPLTRKEAKTKANEVQAVETRSEATHTQRDTTSGTDRKYQTASRKVDVARSTVKRSKVDDVLSSEARCRMRSTAPYIGSLRGRGFICTQARASYGDV